MITIDKTKNIALKASAGTGKTYQLSMRVLSMLLQGVEAKDILGLTFTNKATDEMLERILLFLDKIAKNEIDDDKHMYETIQNIMMEYAQRNNIDYSDKYLQDTAIKTRDKLLADFSSLKIKTFDAFFNTIIKTFPFEVGVRPDYDIKDNVKNSDFEKLAFNQVLKELIKDDEWRQILSLFYKRFAKDDLENFASYTSHHAIILLHEIEKVKINDKSTLLEKMQLTEKTYDAIFDNIRLFINSFDSDMQKKFDALSSKTDLYGILGLAMFKKDIKEVSGFAKYNFKDISLRYYEDIKQNIRDYLKLRGEVATLISILLGDMLTKQFNYLKSQQNIITYDDIAERVFDLLAKDKTIESEYLYFRLDGYINHILIDEFQDTSNTQWAVMERFADEAMAGIGQHDKSGSFFYVGDPKQNIYRFRGGSSELFDKVADNAKSSIVVETLEKNFRSTKNVVEFVNNTFSVISSMYKLDMFKLNQQYNTDSFDGYVNIELLDKKEKTYIEYTIEKITEIEKAKIPYSDIAILVDKNSIGQELLDELSAKNIPVRLETSSNINTSNAYKAIYNLAYFIETGDEFAFMNYVFIDSPSISIKDFTNKSSRTKIMDEILQSVQDMNNATIFEKLIYVIRKNGMATRFQNVPDFIATIDLIANNVANEKNIAVFMEKLNNAAESYGTTTASNDNAITIMTVHKSKGLEFPIVIMPTTDFPLSINSRKTNFVVIDDEDNSIYGKLYYIHPKYTYNYISDSDLFAIDTETNLTVIDSLNKLYVGMTRAKNALFIASNPTGKEIGNASQLLTSICDSRFDSNKYQIGSLTNYPLEKIDKKNKTKLKKVCHYDIGDKIPTNEEYMVDFEATNFGTALHNALMLINGNTTNDIQSAIDVSLSKYGYFISDNMKKTLEIYVKKIINKDIWNKLMTGKVFRERKFTHNGRLYSIDIYSVFSDKIILADYKTGELTKAAESEYKEQIKTYATILNKVYELEVEKYLIHFHGENVEIISF